MTPAPRTQSVLRRIRDIAYPHGVEVGVAAGVMSRELLHHHQGLHLVMVDSWKPAEEQPARYRETLDCHSVLSSTRQEDARRLAYMSTRPYQDRRSIVAADSLVAAAMLPSESFDFVFLDADHSYEGVRADVGAWWPKVRAGGWLCGHDYDGHALLHGVRCDFGVTQAVQSLVAHHAWILELDEDHTWFVRKAQ